MELCQKSFLKRKQCCHFITKSTTVFQNTPYYKIQGHLPSSPVTSRLQVDPPPSRQGQEMEMLKSWGSVLQKLHPASWLSHWRSFEEIRSMISTSWYLVGTKQRASTAWGAGWPLPSSQGPYVRPVWVQRTGRGKKVSQVPMGTQGGAACPRLVWGWGQDTMQWGEALLQPAMGPVSMAHHRSVPNLWVLGLIQHVAPCLPLCGMWDEPAEKQGHQCSCLAFIYMLHTVCIAVLYVSLFRWCVNPMYTFFFPQSHAVSVCLCICIVLYFSSCSQIFIKIFP